MIDVPPTLRRARSAAGERAWLDALPDLVSEMARAWSLSVGRWACSERVLADAERLSA